MNTLVITGCYQSGWDVARRTITSKQRWCERHGYSLLNIERWDPRTFCWQKILMAEQFLADHEVVVWLDADSVITNPEIRVEDLIDTAHAVFVSRDWYPITGNWMKPAFHFSCGNMIFTQHVHRSLIFDTLRRTRAEAQHEQLAMQTMVMNERPGHELVKVLDGSVLNAVPRQLHRDTQNPWDLTCLLAHLTGKNEHRHEWLDRNNVLLEQLNAHGIH